MVDGNKKIEITEDFLEKHRNNTRKYMHLLNAGKEKSENLQETLSRIESKFGVSIKRSLSQDTQIEHIRASSDEKSLQDFIKQIRQKYLSPSDSLPISLIQTDLRLTIKSLNNAELNSEPLIDLSPVKLLTEKPAKDLQTTQNKEKPESLLDLEIPLITPKKTQENQIKTENDHHLDNALQLSDLISEPVQGSPFHKPPRTKHNIDEIAEKEDNNKTLNENSMSMSFRRAHAEQIINNAISDVITNRLKIFKKRPSPRNSQNKLFSFENFLNSGKTKFAPLKKSVSVEQIFKEDSELQDLITRKEQILNELQFLAEEKEKLIERLED